MSNAIGADFSPDRKYRYTLWRDSRWPDSEHRIVNFICLNPSKADEYLNDPTVTRLTKRALLMGYQRMLLTNLFAWRSTDPSELRKVEDPVGPDNDAFILSCARNAHLVVCAWGTEGQLRKRAKTVTAILLKAGIQLHALRITERTKVPEHPLYLPYSAKPEPWTPKEAHT